MNSLDVACTRHHSLLSFTSTSTYSTQVTQPPIIHQPPTTTVAPAHTCTQAPVCTRSRPHACMHECARGSPARWQRCFNPPLSCPVMPGLPPTPPPPSGLSCGPQPRLWPPHTPTHACVHMHTLPHIHTYACSKGSSARSLQRCCSPLFLSPPYTNSSPTHLPISKLSSNHHPTTTESPAHTCAHLVALLHKLPLTPSNTNAKRYFARSTTCAFNHPPPPSPLSSFLTTPT